MKNGSTRLAYKPEHGVDLDTGIVTSAVIHLADQGDTTTLAGTLDAAAAALSAVAAKSGGWRAAIPIDRGQPIRLMAGTDSE